MARPIRIEFENAVYTSTSTRFVRLTNGARCPSIAKGGWPSVTVETRVKNNLRPPNSPIEALAIGVTPSLTGGTTEVRMPVDEPACDEERTRNQTMSRSWRRLLLLLGMIALLCTGIFYLFRPNRTCKFYELNAQTASSDECTMTSSLVGSFHVKGSLTVYSVPYTLILGVRSHDGSDLQLTNVVIEIVGSNGETVFEAADSVTLTTQYDDEERHCTYIESSGLNLDFDDYVMTVSFQIHSRGHPQGQRFTVPFRKKYRQERKNDFLDMILSV